MSGRTGRILGTTRLAALVAGDALVLCLTRPDLSRLLGIAAHPGAALARLGADQVTALVMSAALWLVAAWVALGLLAALGVRAPGLIGRACRAVSDVALPAAVRRVVVGAVGLGLLAGPATSAFATPARAGQASIVSLSATRSTDPAPGPSWPVSTPPSTPPMTPPSTPRAHASTHRSPDRSHDTVRVRAGDSLWLIAAHRLGSGASPERVAAYWPQVYRANRAAVGADPGLVRPGQVLDLPDPHSS